MTALRECAFCGDIAEIRHGFVAYVMCRKCGAHGPEIIEPDSAAERVRLAVEGWNRRADDALLKRCDSALDCARAPEAEVKDAADTAWLRERDQIRGEIKERIT